MTIIYGLIKIMVKETWLETDSKLFSHFSLFTVTIKSGFIRLNHCRKGKTGTCISAKYQWRKKNWKGITVIWSGRNWLKETLWHKTLHVENSTRPPNHINSVENYQAWACTDQTVTESTERRCSLLVKKCIQLFNLIKYYPDVFVMSF